MGNAHHVIIYTTPACVYCKKTKEFFGRHSISYEERDVATDQRARAEMVQKSEQLGVPVIDVDGAIIIGFDQKNLETALGLKV